MRMLFLVVILFLKIDTAYSGDILHFNTKLLGAKIDKLIVLFETKNPDDPEVIYPINIQLDLKNNICTAASIYYSDAQIDIKKVRKIINEKYSVKEYLSGDDFWAWRVEKEKFTISMFKQEECMEDFDLIRICYMEWQDTRDILEKTEKIVNHLNQGE